MQGKTCVITGASSGIGLEAALALGRMGAQLVLLGRNPRHCRTAARALERLPGRPQLAFLTADFARLDEVRRAAGEILERCDRIHALIHNAGAYFPGRRVEAGGLELHLALNHLAPFLLDGLLRDRVLASAPARIVVVASSAHAGGRIDPERLASDRETRGLEAYSRSKLANVLFAAELARRLAGTGVTVNALHPGYVDTRLGREGDPLRYFARRLLKGRGLPAPEAAAALVRLASAPELEGITGKFFSEGLEAEPAPQARDMELAARLWEASERLLAG